MTVEQNQNIVRRLVADVLNDGNLSLLGELVAGNYTDHALPPSMPAGLDSMRQVLAMLRGVFPDLQYSVDDMIAAGDKVVVRFSRRGTQRGAFMGIAPSERAAQWSGIDIFRVADGKIVEHWTSFDQLGMLQQLGAELVMPEPSG